MRNSLSRARFALLTAALAAATTLALAWAPPPSKKAPAEGGGENLVHAVYFSLADRTPENRDTLIAGCDKYLSRHPGVLYYAAGGVSDLAGMYNDRDFDVALILVFENQEAHDKYQASQDHQAFISECVPLVSKVRVFDSTVKKK